MNPPLTKGTAHRIPKQSNPPEASFGRICCVSDGQGAKAQYNKSMNNATLDLFEIYGTPLAFQNLLRQEDLNNTISVGQPGWTNDKKSF